MAPYQWVHLEGVTLPAEVNQTAVRRLAEAAAENGTGVSFDLNGRTNQWSAPDAYRQALRDVLQHCDLIFAGADDLAVAGLDPTPAGLLELLPSDHSATAFITDGAAETTAITVDDGAITAHATATPPAATVATAAGAATRSPVRSSPRGTTVSRISKRWRRSGTRPARPRFRRSARSTPTPPARRIVRFDRAV
ncbi:PfkB family carbohydrate kinase [Halorubrum saccharovorum]|uniref:carbohydrate kinase family protein n=1 Tax=Halorubrum saccharovorum TaxID=2248 RepID=UPI0026985B31|nr:PfkB family carbohydrate kinase [Halorubrum saccharovorum]